MSTKRGSHFRADRDSPSSLETVRNRPGGPTRRSGTTTRRGRLFMGDAGPQNPEVKRQKDRSSMEIKQYLTEMIEHYEMNNICLLLPQTCDS